MTGRSVCRGLLALVLSISVSDASANPESRCVGQDAVEKVIAEQLPVFQLPVGVYPPEDVCGYLAQGDFNGDSKTDYAASLTEAMPLRQYGDGTPVQRSFLTVFLSQPTPYSAYQAVVLLGYDSAIGKYKLTADRRGDKTELVVVRKRYSITRFRWGRHGFEAQHSAD